MIDNTAQQTLDFIQYSSIFGELEKDSGERGGEKYPLERPPQSLSGSGGGDNK